MVRIGTVPFLVARPISFGLDQHAELQLTVAPPAELGRLLRAGELDLALASSVLTLEHPELKFWTEGPVIAARGSVRSVLVLLRPGIEAAEVRSLALDPASRSGRALARVILREVHGARPALHELDPEQALQEQRCDAVQIIGDRALQLAQRFPDWKLLDLGETWTNWTGLPFVFAGWIARPGFDVEQVASILRRSAVEGMAKREAMIPDGVRIFGRDSAFVRRYLFEDLVSSLPPHEVRAALGAFQTRLGLTPR